MWGSNRRLLQRTDSLGIFTAPVPGAYYFTFSYHSAEKNPSGLKLMKSGSLMVQASDTSATGITDNAGNSAVLYLQQGEENAGFFNATSNQRLSNVVSDGRMVRDSGGQQDAQFGIRKDGSLVFGYLSQEDVLDRSNPFIQLVSGVVWLRKHKERERQSQNPNTKVFCDFVDVLSARTVVGHDADGNLILFHVDGKTKKRGMNLWEVADFLKKNGVIDAINLDGGGQGWRGAACDSLVCRPPACGPHGVCSASAFKQLEDPSSWQTGNDFQVD
ncbi:N-acetylglucosamine-1-phosphodiester alpha-N-acetylglucosaminidase-like [Symphorus nematophorus]